MTYKNTDTPCIGVCSTVYGDDVCRGCKRFANEIIEWNTYTPHQKSNVLSRLDRLTTETAKHYLVVTDANALELACKSLNVRYRQEFHPVTWAYMLLKMRADKISFPEQYGFTVLAEYENVSLQQIIDQIDEKVFLKSQKLLHAL